MQQGLLVDRWRRYLPSGACTQDIASMPGDAMLDQLSSHAASEIVSSSLQSTSLCVCEKRNYLSDY